MRLQVNIELRPSGVLRAVARQFDLLDENGAMRSEVGRISMAVPGLAKPLVLYSENEVYKASDGRRRISSDRDVQAHEGKLMTENGKEKLDKGQTLAGKQFCSCGGLNRLPCQGPCRTAHLSKAGYVKCGEFYRLEPPRRRS